MKSSFLRTPSGILPARRESISCEFAMSVKNFYVTENEEEFSPKILTGSMEYSYYENSNSVFWGTKDDADETEEEESKELARIEIREGESPLSQNANEGTEVTENPQKNSLPKKASKSILKTGWEKLKYSVITKQT
jgi:hypothetical protein